MTLKRLLRILLAGNQIDRLLNQQRTIILEQSELLDKQTGIIQTIQLEHVSDMQGIVGAWLLNIEQPEIDVRSDLSEFYTELGFRRAALEEHIL